MMVSSRVDMLEDEFAKLTISIHQGREFRKPVPSQRKRVYNSLGESLSDCAIVACRISLIPIVHLSPSLQIVGANFSAFGRLSVTVKPLGMDRPRQKRK